MDTATDTGELMDALVYEAPHVMAVRRVPVPVAGPRDVVVQVQYSGICGSELSGFVGQSSLRTPPLVFGHEVAGVVVAIGSDVERSRVPLGARVTVNPLITCGECPRCVGGREQLCMARQLLGATRPGSNAEFVSVPATAVHRIPDRLGLEQAAMVEPLAFALHAVEVGGVADGAGTALVVGAGAIGLFVIQALRLRGTERVLVAELNPDRLAMAVALGADPLPTGETRGAEWVHGQTAGQGADVTVDAVGTQGTRRLCLDAVRSGGTMVLAGLHTDETTLPLNSVVRSEIAIRGVFAYGPRHFTEALGLIADGRAGLTEGVVVAPLAEGQHWFERLVAGDATAKVLLAPGRAGAVRSSM